jgi:YfiH family protein
MPNAVLVFKKDLPRGSFCVYQSRPDFDLIRVKQTHSNIVLNENFCSEQVADGIVGDSKTPLAILTADCVPILLLGEHGHAMVHAGWRGLESEILRHELIEKIKPNYAFIGPHIKVDQYIVQSDFKSHFTNPTVFQEKDGKIFFDLLAMTMIQLNEYFPGIIIEESGIDTFTNELFFSYRRNKTTDRNWNIYIP